MNIINNIVFFSNDSYLLALLKGYCYSNDINFINSDFTIRKLTQIKNISKSLVLLPVELLNLADKVIELALLKRILSNDEVFAFCINNNESAIGLNELPTWITGVVNYPFDIEQIDQDINKYFINHFLSERRVHGERRELKERRSFFDRRKSALPANSNQLVHFNNVPQFCNDAIGCTDFFINQRVKSLFIRGCRIDLTPKEFELISLLTKDADRVFSADEIIKSLWSENNRATKSDLYQYMHLLRKKVEKDPDHPEWIITVKGFGYKLSLNTLQNHTETY